MTPAALARLPAAGDNVAIATQTLLAGTLVDLGGSQVTLDAPVLEGHRFAAQPVVAGALLLSWGLPFGRAIRPIPAGAYVCNAAMLESQRGRPLPFALPAQPNFEDHAAAFVLDEAGFQPGAQVTPYAEPRFFLGYPRGGGRGVGTRNHIVLLGATSRVAGFVRALEARLQGLAADYPNLDAIVAVAHTEGAGAEPHNNRTLLLRTLAGFIVNPNVGAVLIVDDGVGPFTNASVRDCLAAGAYPLDSVPHHFLSLAGDFEADLQQAAALVSAWAPRVGAAPRVPASLAHLNVGLQCGGSDAFSGVSANPLAGAVAREIIRYGGMASLAETTELIGAESYVLQNVRDLDTARAFLKFGEWFKEMLAWHGVTGEGNVSGGNRYRGLYNIILKSIGAAAKRAPDVRLDYAVDYAERMPAPGFYFMNTPGNDLESIAGQVAGGANLLIFTTGNGSITNFPFVPTIKVMTTTARYQLLPREMDVNAGAYLDGAPLEDLTRATLDLTVAIASGARSKGEQAGHTQVSIWRNWAQTGPGQVAAVLAAPEPDGRPLPIRTDEAAGAALRFRMRRVGERLTADQVGLILPTSLCAGQIARLAASRLNALGLGREQGLSRFVALVHTEGCGAAGHSTGALYHRTLLNYIGHPLVSLGLFLEHGCEKTHNDYMRAQLEQHGGDPGRFGWASVQLDGGLDAVLHKIEAWFRRQLAGMPAPEEHLAGLGALKLGLLSAGLVPAAVAAALARLTRSLVSAGGTVVVPQTTSLLQSDAYLAGTLAGRAAEPSLAHGQAAVASGFHIMATPSAHWVETLTGLGATGVEILLAYPGERTAQGHPLVPMLQVTPASPAAASRAAGAFDLVLQGASKPWAGELLRTLAAVAAGEQTPKLFQRGDVDFQMTRGLLGVTV